MSGRFHRGVAGLDHLLRMAQVSADENVHVAGIGYLLKRHGCLRKKG
jgi:hypothetical protein